MLETKVIELILQGIESFAVLFAGIFGLLELRQLKVEHEVRGSAVMLQSLQSPESGSTALLIYALPEGLSGEQLKQALGDHFAQVIRLASMIESMGPLVARGHIAIEVYEDFYRGLTVVCWRKLQVYIEAERAAGWSNLFEWFQWLAEQMAARAPMDDDIPAFERLRNWKQPADYAQRHRR